VPTLAGIVRRIGTQPLLLAQAASSAAGALAMVIPAAVMTPPDFSVFALLVLASVTAMGAVRAALFQPALIEIRHDKDAHVSGVSATVGAACAALLTVLTAAFLEVSQPLWLVALGVTSTLPVYVEWLRMRAMALDRRWEVVHGDLFRLAATLAAPVVLWLSTDVETFFLFVNLTYLTTAGYLWYRLPAVPGHVSVRRLWRPASSQLVDFAVAQAVSTLPLLVFGSLASSVYIGGVRLAQTLLGPLNMVLAASAYNLLSDGATRESHADDADLIKRGRRLAALLGVFSLVLVGGLLGFLAVTGLNLRGVDNHSLIVGIALVGGLAITTGFAWIDTFTLRLLGHHIIPTVGRTVLVAVTLCAYVVGYARGGVDTSLVWGFLTAAVASPFVIIFPATLAYRRHRTKPDAPQKDQAEGMVSS
jgi:hypothetical protein